MELEDLMKLKNCNELDLIHKIIEISKNNVKDVEQVLKGNKTAGIRVRKMLQGIKFLSEVIREKTQIRINPKKLDKISKLDKAIAVATIQNEKERIENL